MTHTIKILDTGLDRYTIDPAQIVLGRQYDDKADTIIVEVPESEKDNMCIMYVIDINGTPVDNIILNDLQYTIRNNVSQNRYVKIGFRFINRDGYNKGSEMIVGQFLPSPMPDSFVPTDPEQKKNIEYLVKYGFTDLKLVGNEIQAFNMSGEKVVAFDLSPFTQEQSDLGETDVSRETFVKGKKTSNLRNDGEDGTSPYATQEWTLTNAGKIDTISVNGVNVPADEDKNVNLEVLDLTSEQQVLGRKIFDAETEFNSPINSNADINITNSVLKVMDDTDGKDMVTQYSADEIVVEDNGAEYTLTLPKKTGTIALTTDVPDVDVDNTTITKNDDGQLQAVALKDTASGMTLTAEQIWLACSIEREV